MTAPRRLARVSYVGLIQIFIAVVVLSSVAVVAIRRLPLLQSPGPKTGNLTINTRPGGSEVLIDGELRGVAPLTLALTPGSHTITVRGGSDERVVPLTIAAGADVSQYFEMKAAEPAISGQLSIVTDPPGALVAVDRRPFGVSPVTVGNLTADNHKVTVKGEAGVVERTVALTAGSTTSVMFSLSKPTGPVGGWFSIAAPFEVEVLERDDVIGTSGLTRIMVPSGRHDIVLRNRSLGYVDPRSIEVTAGKTIAIRVDPPKVPVSMNARPWAEIAVDGKHVGQTPIANLRVAIGSHELVFRHPRLGERKQTAVVTVKGPNRFAADFSK